MKKLLGYISAFLYLCAASALSWAADTTYSGRGGDKYESINGKCADGGGDGKTILIIPRVYISFVGKDYCWSEIREVEIQLDFLKMQDIAKENGDTYTAGIMSHGNLVDFFTWLLEAGIYAMPGDALFGILGYAQRNDYAGLYGLYRSFGASRRLNRNK